MMHTYKSIGNLHIMILDASMITSAFTRESLWARTRIIPFYIHAVFLIFIRTLVKTFVFAFINIYKNQSILSKN